MRQLPFFFLVGLSGLLQAQPITWTIPCTDKVFCLNTGSCTTGFGMMNAQAQTTCGGSGTVNLSYRIDYYNDGSTDLQGVNDSVSGNFPIGTHRITWRAADFCFNTSSCSYLFTIRDCAPPNMLCMSGAIQSIEIPECEAVFTPSQFILSLNDNCTPANQLELGIRELNTGSGFPANSPSVSFGACDVGANFVEIWVRDAGGLVSQCNAYVLVQQNSSQCTCNPDGDLIFRGCATQHDGTRISGYRAIGRAQSFGGSGTPVVRTKSVFNVDSCFRDTIKKLPFGENYNVTIRAERTDTPLNGVTALDLLLISRNILGLQLLPSFYEVAAADVNRSGTVTSFDIVDIRKVLLGISDTFSAVQSWEFIRPIANPATLPYTLAALRDTYQFTYTNLVADAVMPAVNFIALKSGDVNNSALGSDSLLTADTREEKKLAVYFNGNRYLQAGDTAHIPLVFPAALPLSAWQLALITDAKRWEWLPPEGLAGMEWHIADDGRFRGLWYQEDSPSHWEEGEQPVLCTLVLRAKAAAWLYEAIGMEAGGLPNEAYGADYARFALAIQPGSGRMAPVFASPRPNPAREEVFFQWSLPEASEVCLELWDMAGVPVHRQCGSFPAGASGLRVGGNELPPPGIYAYRISTAGGFSSGRVYVAR